MKKKAESKPKARFTAADLASVRSPPLTDEQLARMRPARDVIPEVLALVRRHRGPQKRPTKRQITLRLDPDVIAHFRARGKGWQVRINAALRKAAGI
jgi:uncharacterized protein (DUF4415 family)